MKEYDGYINQIKSAKHSVDFDEMYSKVQDRITKMQPYPMIRVYFAGVVALFIALLSFTLYTNIFAPQDSATLMAYVMDDSIVNGSPVIEYIFE